MVVRRKDSSLALGALLVASAIGGTIAIASGCTVLTNDALPDDAGLFEAGDAKASACTHCLAVYCAAQTALCVTSSSCVNVMACARGSSAPAPASDSGTDAGVDADADADTDAEAGTPAPDPVEPSQCACDVAADGGPSPERLYRAYTSCNDAKLTTCANDCASENRAPTTPPLCTEDDAGATDGGVPEDAGDADAGDAGSDAGTPGAATFDAGPPGPDACIACATATCGAALNACGAATECGEYLDCSSACTTASCVEDCGARHATGKVAAAQLATCTASNCQKACEL